MTLHTVVPDQVRDPLRELAESLRAALLGSAADACTQAVGFAGALAADADIRPVDAGDGLWAVLRTSADGRSRVLCVHNLADEPASFLLADVLPARPGHDIHFLRGEVRTDGTDMVSLCRLQARSYVWLGQRETR